MSRVTWDEMKARADGGLGPRGATDFPGRRALQVERDHLLADIALSEAESVDLERRVDAIRRDRQVMHSRVSEIGRLLGDEPEELCC